MMQLSIGVVVMGGGCELWYLPIGNTLVSFHPPHSVINGIWRVAVKEKTRKTAPV